VVHVRARGEVEELVVKTVWNVGADTCTLGVIPDLRRWTAQSLVVVDAAALARVFVVNVLLFVAVVWLHSAPTLARRVFLHIVHTDVNHAVIEGDTPHRFRGFSDNLTNKFDLILFASI